MWICACKRWAKLVCQHGSRCLSPQRRRATCLSSKLQSAPSTRKQCGCSWSNSCPCWRPMLPSRMPLMAMQVLRKPAFFIDGPAGTGKPFLYNLLFAYVRAEEGIALASASCGLPALILKGGRTAHSRFKINIPPTEYCNLSKNSAMAKLIKDAKLIIWRRRFA